MDYPALIDALLARDGVEAVRRGEVGSVLTYEGLTLGPRFQSPDGGFAYAVHRCPCAGGLPDGFFTPAQERDAFAVVDLDADPDQTQLRSLLRQAPAFLVVPSTTLTDEELTPLVSSDMGIVALPLIVCA